MKALVIGGTSGIGKSIYDNIKPLFTEVVKTSRKELDTSSIDSVKKFIKKYKDTKFDVLILNTGGPPDLKFEEISNEIWLENNS